jgi:FtsZ-interacting cell division protein YlmF
LYTGFDNITFVSKTSCVSQRSGACSRNSVIRNKNNVANRIRASAKGVNAITRPIKPRLDLNLRTFTNSSTPLNKNAAQAFFNKVNKFLPYFTEDELVKVERILDSIERRITPANKNIVNRNLRVLRRGITIAKTGENRGNQSTARPRSNNRGNQSTARPRSNNRGNQSTARPRSNNQMKTNNQRPAQTPRQNNQGNQKTATPRPNGQNNRMNTNNQGQTQQNGIFARLRKRART